MSKSSSTRTQTPTTHKIIRFHILLKELKLEYAKADMLAGYGVDSTKLLTEIELGELIAALEKKKSITKAATTHKTRKLRHQILNLLAAIGIENKGNTQVYWERVNAYMSNTRIAGKTIPAMTDEELEKCIRKLHMVKKEVDKRLQDEKHWASMN